MGAGSRSASSAQWTVRPRSGHGEQDRNDPVAMASAQERRLSHVRAIYYPDDGHLIFFSRIEEILSELAAP